MQKVWDLRGLGLAVYLYGLSCARLLVSGAIRVCSGDGGAAAQAFSGEYRLIRWEFI